ncbi:MAG: hypothetical protein WB698_05030 [Solirubrobacteraceae bacterium]
MAQGLILEFDGFGRDTYEAVNEQMGIDMVTGQGVWPPGLISHAGGPKPGGWVVMEIWESHEDQERFMQDRLGRALQQSGVSGPPSRLEWLDLAAYHTPSAA